MITDQENAALLNYLGDMPAKYANPLINTLTQLEETAIARAKMIDSAKAADAKAEAEKKAADAKAPKAAPDKAPEKK